MYAGEVDLGLTSGSPTLEFAVDNASFQLHCVWYSPCTCEWVFLMDGGVASQYLCMYWQMEIVAHTVSWPHLLQTSELLCNQVVHVIKFMVHLICI